MSRNKFVDSNLVNIKDRLSDNGSIAKSESSYDSSNNSSKSTDNKRGFGSKSESSISVISERDWKKALFQRWDEFKRIKADLLNRVTERIASSPDEIKELEADILSLKSSCEKYEMILSKLNRLDDSEWNRQNFSTELSSSIRSVENARIEFMVIAKKKRGNGGVSLVESSQVSNNIIHELNSLTFGNLFKIGFAFFMPLILGIIVAVMIWGGIYYLSIN